jgi:hypothetical protein
MNWNQVFARFHLQSSILNPCAYFHKNTLDYYYYFHRLLFVKIMKEISLSYEYNIIETIDFLGDFYVRQTFLHLMWLWSEFDVYSLNALHSSCISKLWILWIFPISMSFDIMAMNLSSFDNKNNLESYVMHA